MSNSKQFKDHAQRLVTGMLIGVPLVTVLAVGPYWMLGILVAVASLTALWEFQRMLSPEPLSRLWQTLSFSAGLLLPLGAALGGFAGLHGTLITGIFSAFVCLLACSPSDPSEIARLTRVLSGWLYIPYLLSYVLLVGRLADGSLWVLYIVFVNSANDIAALYCGRQWGRRKLLPAVSPKKTVEGALGGLAASLAVGLAYGTLFLKGVSAAELLLLSGILAVLGQMGDLFESMIKRMSGIKDSSHLLPGHGGILDRLDSLLFVIPATFYYLARETAGLF